MRHLKKAFYTIVHASQSRLTTYVACDMRQRKASNKELYLKGKMIIKLKEMLVQDFDERYPFLSYTVKYLLVVYMVKYIQRFETPCILYAFQHEYAKLYICVTCKTSMLIN